MLRSAASTSDGYTFTPLTTSMSSARPLIRLIRTDVRPHSHGAREGRDVARPVPQHGQRALRQGRQDELPLLALRARCTRDGIHDLRQEVVVHHVQAVARLAFPG